MTAKRCHGDAGQVGGIEAVPFGLVVLVVGVLVLAHTWAVVDAKSATASAAREATRVYVEASTQAQGEADARQAAADAAAAVGRPLDGLDLTAGSGSFGRCAPAGFVARLTVPGFGLPWRPDRPVVDVRSAHRELVDPYRDGLPGLADCEVEP